MCNPLIEETGYPGAVFPTGLRVEKIDVKDSTHKPFNKLDRILQDACPLSIA